MKKVISLALAIVMLLSATSAFADTKILIKNERGSLYSDKDWGPMPEKTYMTQANAISKTYQSEYVIEKAKEKIAEITTDVKDAENPIFLSYDKEGKLVGVKATTDKNFRVEENVADIKGFCWKDGKLIPYGDTKTDMPKQIDIILVGDSSACNWPTDYYPEEGYGKFLADYFNRDYAKFLNHAVSGASTKTFLDDNKRLGDWATTLERVGEGDYVLIDLGGNDRNHLKDENGVFSEETYKANLTKMYNDVKAKGANVIFTAVLVIASEVGDDGRIKMAADRKRIAQIKEELAKELGCEFWGCQQDLMNFYNSEIERIGSLDDMRGLYFRDRKYLMDENGPFALAYEDTLIPNNFEADREYDYTHSTVYGADAVAQIIYQYIMKNDSALKLYTK